MTKRSALQTAAGAALNFFRTSVPDATPPHVSTGTSTSWVADAEAKLREMSKLKPGWDTYDAEPPNKISLKLLRDLLGLLQEHDLQPNGTGPSAVGGGSFDFLGEATDRYAEIEVENDSEVNIFVTKIFPSSRKTETWGFPYDRAKLVESIEMIIRFLKGEDVPTQEWLMRFEEPEISSQTWRWK